MSVGSSNRMFGPLFFETHSSDVNLETKCLLCDDSFNLDISLSVFAVHIFDLHKIIIEDIQKIKKLQEYVLYWREKFKCTPLEQIIPSVTIDTTGNKYFVFSSLLKEDKELRHRLRLEHAIRIQEFERKDEHFTRSCLFCKLQFEGTRPGYLEHLSTQHNLQLGNPQNLVFIDTLVNKIDQKLKDLQCIYCDKSFPDRNTLKEHMRKKLHKRIHPQNTDYDEFYMINYLEDNKTWHSLNKEDDIYTMARGINSDEEYEDWCEKEDGIICLFCEKRETNINCLCLHMYANHDFSFIEETSTLNFYQKIKLVNYIRKQVHDNKCLFCEESFTDNYDLTNHLMRKRHYKLPEVKTFDQPEFYFPTYENDAFLYFIDDVED